MIKNLKINYSYIKSIKKNENKEIQNILQFQNFD